MTLAQFPALQRRVTGVVCLSTPFIQASAVDVQAFEADVREILTLPKIGFLTFVMYASLLIFESQGARGAGSRHGSLCCVASVLQVFRRVRPWSARETDQTAILKTYNYNAIPVPILGASDDGGRGVRVDSGQHITGGDRNGHCDGGYGSRSGGVCTVDFRRRILGRSAHRSGFDDVFGCQGAACLGSVWGPGHSVRALSRACSHFHVSRHLGEVPVRLSLQIPAPVGKTLGRLRIRHSFLYQSDEAASAITDLSRAVKFRQWIATSPLMGHEFQEGLTSVSRGK